MSKRNKMNELIKLEKQSRKEQEIHMPEQNYIVSLSGGKDSTAMLHWMLDEDILPIHSVVFFDTGWEFPAMHKHLKQIEEKTGIEIIRLKPAESFYYHMFEHRTVAKKGLLKGRVHRIGAGWANYNRRWCTRIKVEALRKYQVGIKNSISCVGIAVDETKRKIDKKNKYPLIEFNKTEEDCLEYCKSLGYHWNGLYDIFNRVSCYCCPLQKISDLRNLREHFPDLWNQMLEWDMIQPPQCEGFRGDKTLIDMEKRFIIDDEKTS